MSDKQWLDMFPQNVKRQIDVPLQSLPQMLLEKIKTYEQHISLSFQGPRPWITYEQLGAIITNVAQLSPVCHRLFRYIGGWRHCYSDQSMPTERKLTYILNDFSAETIVVLDDLYPIVKRFKTKQM